MKKYLATTCVLVLGACTAQTTGQGVFSSWNREAGAWTDVRDPGFGNSTMNNMMAQMCRGRAKGFVPRDPVVVLDPTRSTPTRPVYARSTIRCSGELNGKYAEVIFQEYVTSATETTTLSQQSGAEFAADQ